jgi:hypothetical protein
MTYIIPEWFPKFLVLSKEEVNSTWSAGVLEYWSDEWVI